MLALALEGIVVEPPALHKAYGTDDTDELEEAWQSLDRTLLENWQRS